MGGKQLHAGGRGSGAALKLAANALFAIQVVALAEINARLEARGIEPETGIALLEETPLLSPAARAAAGLMLAEKDDAMFPIDLVAKDLRYAIAETPDASPIAGAALECFERMVAAGHGGLNLTGVRLAFA
ncbi:NAD-binding protein [Erythrobacter mangrovi]|nr:NAD-binding protein [Erythrobacter mangrovi]